MWRWRSRSSTAGASRRSSRRCRSATPRRWTSRNSGWRTTRTTARWPCIRRCGAPVTEWRPPEARTGLDIFYGILASDGGKSARQKLRGGKKDRRIGQLVALAGLPRPLLAGLRGLLRATGQRNAAALLRTFGHRDALHYWRLVDAQTAYRRRFLAAMDADEGGPFDVIVCPACALPAIPHGASADLVTAGAYAALYNVLGFPAGIVPFTRVRAGEDTPRKRSLDRMERAARRTELGSAGLPVG